ncbi:MAG: S9 family peptidase [Prevotellaceae bacterium]|jgi:dipeptidyl-peptidase-4|nr:S9 family peptidase [Prevotellaceae bacterium]
MKRFAIILILSVFIQVLSANLLYDITDGIFRAKNIPNTLSMNDGEHYAQLVGKKAVVKYNYRSGAFVDTVFSVSQVKNCPFDNISGYEFSPDESKLILYANPKMRYRRSFTADYYIYDVKQREISPLSEYGAQEAPLFSPDSRYVAFARNNNLFMKKLDFGTEIPLTKDGEMGKVINGIADWVYEEEFTATRYFEWSADSKQLAFVKFEERDVPLFEMQLFDKPEKDGELPVYPSLYTFKYPKAGMPNSKASVCVYEDFYKTTKVMKFGEQDGDFYIPRIQWTNAPEQLAVFRLNRNQNQLDIYFANPKSTVTKLILRQEDKYYVDYENVENTCFTQDGRYFITISEEDGYRHIYQYQMNGTLHKQLTKGKWDVTKFYGYDETRKTLYFQSAEVSPLQRDVYSLDGKGKKTRLTNGQGTHDASFNSRFSMFVDNASSLKSPGKLTLCDHGGKAIRVLEDNAALAEKFASLNLPEKRFFNLTTSKGVTLNGWIIQPEQADASKKYPVLLTQYSGPDSQSALDRWNIGWEYYLATKGYVVVCVDGRGTGARGSEFRKCTYQQLGLLETEDQIETAKYMAKQPYVDAERIGIWGWSYGGFMTLMAMSSGENIIKAGIAVAPVTDWRLYDSAYTERFMRRPQENFAGYDQASPLLKADKLQGRLLIVHGTSDDNVHVQNTMLYIKRLVEAEKQFEMQLYTDKNHSILGTKERRHLYTRMSEFLFRNL